MLQQKPSYHHKDLRNALIETGIELVTTEGIDAFSLRKVAAACGVSHAAPYSHFKNKEDLLEAMQIFITDQFSTLLENIIQNNDHASTILKELGVAYISFFMEHSTYYQFLYAQSNIKIDLSFTIADDENYKPFVIYKNTLNRFLQNTQYSDEKRKDIIITIWAFIQGVTSLATMNNVSYDQDWQQKVLDFMDIFQLPFVNEMGDRI